MFYSDAPSRLIDSRSSSHWDTVINFLSYLHSQVNTARRRVANRIFGIPKTPLSYKKSLPHPPICNLDSRDFRFQPSPGTCVPRHFKYPKLIHRFIL